jgi:curved DNA-binding protein CbpA
MEAGEFSDDDLERMLSLNPECDPTSLSLTPVEGYLLSRVDGHTSWRLLREIGGLPPEETDLCIEGWLAQGLLRLGDCAKPQSPPRAAEAHRSEPPARSASSDPIGESALDPALDLPLEVQRRILEFQSRLDLPYHEILGVAPDADVRTMKRAYLDLSKEFHPDRYFRREIGEFVDRLNRIFKGVLEAYELLSDPATRAEVQKNLVSSSRVEAQASEPDREEPTQEKGAPAADGTASAPKPPLTPIERLRQRMPFKIPESVLAERRQKAAQFFQTALRSQERGHFKEAASSIRLAIAFDPFNAESKRVFAEIQAGCAESKIEELIQDSDSSGVASQQRKTLELCEEVLLYRPHNPEVNDRAARMAAELNDFAKAREYAERAVEHSPDMAKHHTTLGRVYRQLGNKGHTVRELEKALELDPHDEEAMKLLDLVKRRPSSATGRGRMS